MRLHHETRQVWTSSTGGRILGIRQRMPFARARIARAREGVIICRRSSALAGFSFLFTPACTLANSTLRTRSRAIGASMKNASRTNLADLTAKSAQPTPTRRANASAWSLKEMDREQRSAMVASTGCLNPGDAQPRGHNQCPRLTQYVDMADGIRCTSGAEEAQFCVWGAQPETAFLCTARSRGPLSSQSCPSSPQQPLRVICDYARESCSEARQCRGQAITGDREA